LDLSGVWGGGTFPEKKAKQERHQLKASGAGRESDKVRELLRKLCVCAKQSKTQRFHALYDRIYFRTGNADRKFNQLDTRLTQWMIRRGGQRKGSI
jgi:hypothetical protein